MLRRRPGTRRWIVVLAIASLAPILAGCAALLLAQPSAGEHAPNSVSTLAPHLPLPVVFLFHRLTRTRSLEHPHRVRLLGLAKAKPGILVAEAARSMQLSYHTVHHHTRILRDFGYVEIVRAGRNLAVYPVGCVAPKLRKPLVHLRRGPQAATLRLVIACPGEGASQLARRMGCRKSSAHAKLKSLQTAGLLAMDEARRYTATEQAAVALSLLEPPAATAPSPATPIAAPIAEAA